MVVAIRALEVCEDLGRERVRHALRIALVKRQEHLAAFDALFDRFWVSMAPPAIEAPGVVPPPAPAAADADSGSAGRGAVLRVASTPASSGDDAVTEADDTDAAGSASAVERLRRVDFAEMSAVMLADVEREIAALRILLTPVVCHRSVLDPRGRRIDLHATLQQGVRGGGDCTSLVRRGPGVRAPALVVLCDISGSMQRYAGPMLALMRAAVRGLEHVHGFVFGTRLTDVTRGLARRDTASVRTALTESVQDFSGGTRIGACLGEFNRRWAGRLLNANATVLLVTDGLERGDTRALAREAARLHRSCRRLVWLNPLLRFEGFAPLSGGIRALLPHTDAHLPTHNLASVEAALRNLCATRRRDSVDGLRERATGRA